jgi:hypothetical protein
MSLPVLLQPISKLQYWLVCAKLLLHTNQAGVKRILNNELFEGYVCPFKGRGKVGKIEKKEMGGACSLDQGGVRHVQGFGGKP